MTSLGGNRNKLEHGSSSQIEAEGKDLIRVAKYWNRCPERL